MDFRDKFLETFTEARRAPKLSEKEIYNGMMADEFLEKLYDIIGDSGEIKVNDVVKKVFGRIPTNIKNSETPAYVIKVYLERQGYVERVGRGIIQFTDKGLKAINKYGLVQPTDTSDPDVTDEYDSGEEIDDSDTLSKAKDITKGRVKKFPTPTVGRNNKFLERCKSIISHMNAQIKEGAKPGIMLAGDPGTGKTSFVVSFAKLMGLPLITIEAPHVTQEHLINIPFLVLNDGKEERGNIVFDQKDSADFDIVRAESNLVTKINTQRKIKDNIHVRRLRSNRLLYELYNKLERLIKPTRNHYKVILFVDEYYRAGDIKVTNVLRNILNGRVGDSKVPAGTYPIFASNFRDEGVDTIPENNYFVDTINFDVPSKDDWFTWFHSKYAAPLEDEESEEMEPADFELTPPNKTDYERTEEGVAAYREAKEQYEINLAAYNKMKEEQAQAERVNMNPTVYTRFLEAMEDEDFGNEDGGLRISPRRLEQILIYVNSALPVANVEEANSLIQFIKTNMTDYVSGEVNPMVVRYTEIAKDLIRETSDVDPTNLTGVAPENWRFQLKDQLKQKMKLGDNRKYIPIVSGIPGIGKTAIAKQLGDEMGLKLFDIDVANEAAENVLGMPISKSRDNDIETDFSEPPLYARIMKWYNTEVKDMEPNDYGYRGIILFDELSRAEVAVFNGIRKVLLEKEFGEGYKLPNDLLMFGAMNPTGEGTDEFTDHIKDVVDVISTAPSWPDTLKYIKNSSALKKIDDEVGIKISDSVVKSVEYLSNMFSDGLDDEGNDVAGTPQENFYLNDGMGGYFYFSPRSYTNTCENIAQMISMELILEDYSPMKEYSEDDYENLINIAIDAFGKKFAGGIQFKYMQVSDNKQFTQSLIAKINADGNIRDFFSKIKENQKKALLLSDIVTLNDEGFITNINELSFYDYVTARDNTSSVFVQDLSQMLGVFSIKSTKDVIQKINMLEGLKEEFYALFDEMKLTGQWKNDLSKMISQTKSKMIDWDDLTLEEIRNIIKDEELINSLNFGD